MHPSLKPPLHLLAWALLPMLLIPLSHAYPNIDVQKSLVQDTSPQTRYFNFVVKYTNMTRLCHSKALVSINDQFPAPTLYVREGDMVVVNVTNRVPYNITIHWHGVRQLLSAWADGPSYITQCPIQTGHSYVHRFKIVGQRGTLFYHAHASWLRATVYGAFIILPKAASIYPHVKPLAEFVVMIGEWWNADVENVIQQALQLGAAYNYSDALTINGQPGALYNCSLLDTKIYNVTQGRTYMLRIINAAINFQTFVGVSGHSLTVVEVDGEYTKPYTTDILVLGPGQTMNVLLTASQPIGQYYISASVFSPTAMRQLVPFPQTPTTAILRYHGAPTVASPSLAVPAFPVFNDFNYAANFTKSLRGLSNYTSGFFVPQTVDESLFFTIGYATRPCRTCNIPFLPQNHHSRLQASINNITFSEPRQLSLQEAYYNHVNGVYEDDFPSEPLFQYNYTGTAPFKNSASEKATKVKVFEFGTSVQIVFQDTSTFFFEGHPIHLHGTNFFVVGEGFGTFNASTDTAKFNLVDPPSRNTVAVPSGGWAAIRFTATNPGVWFMHCHFEIHASWGMAMAFIVKNGNTSAETLPPPPADLPKC